MRKTIILSLLAVGSVSLLVIGCTFFFHISPAQALLLPSLSNSGGTVAANQATPVVAASETITTAGSCSNPSPACQSQSACGTQDSCVGGLNSGCSQVKCGVSPLYGGCAGTWTLGCKGIWTAAPITITTTTTTRTSSTGSSTTVCPAWGCNGIQPVTGPVSTVVPVIPANLNVTGETASSISLSWTASTETNGTIAGYKIYRGGVQAGTSITTSFTDVTLAASTTYSYTVVAYDAKGNVSSPSASVRATTESAILPGVLMQTLLNATSVQNVVSIAQDAGYLAETFTTGETPYVVIKQTVTNKTIGLFIGTQY